MSELEDARMTPDHCARLSVTAGRHVGASLELNPGTTSLGNSLDCDVILTDPDVAAHHCSITLQQKLMRVTAEIAAVDDPVVVNGQLIEAGTKVDATLPFTLDLGEASLQFSRQPHTIGVGKAAGLATVALLVGGGLFAGISSLLDDGPAFPPTSPNRPSISASAPTRATQGQVTLDTRAATVSAAAQRAAALETMISSAGLGALMSVERQGDAIVIDGVLDTAGFTKWRQVKQSYLETDSSGVPIIDIVKTSTAANSPQNLIATAVFGADPYVITAGGRKASVGQTIEDGWIVTAISTSGVRLKRGKNEFTVSLTVEPKR